MPKKNKKSQKKQRSRSAPSRPKRSKTPKKGKRAKSQRRGRPVTTQRKMGAASSNLRGQPHIEVELWTNISAPLTDGLNSAFAVVNSTFVNPGNPILNPRATQLSKIFEEYVVDSAIIEYVPTVPDAYAGGTVGVLADPDPSDLANTTVASLQAALQEEFVMAGNPSQRMCLVLVGNDVGLDKNHAAYGDVAVDNVLSIHKNRKRGGKRVNIGTLPKYYTKDGNVDTNDAAARQQNLCDIVPFYDSPSGPPGTTGTYKFGNLRWHVCYRFQHLKPQNEETRKCFVTTLQNASTSVDLNVAIPFTSIVGDGMGSKQFSHAVGGTWGSHTSAVSETGNQNATGTYLKPGVYRVGGQMELSALTAGEKIRIGLIFHHRDSTGWFSSNLVSMLDFTFSTTSHTLTFSLDFTAVDIVMMTPIYNRYNGATACFIGTGTYFTITPNSPGVSAQRSIQSEQGAWSKGWGLPTEDLNDIIACIESVTNGTVIIHQTEEDSKEDLDGWFEQNKGKLEQLIQKKVQLPAVSNSKAEMLEETPTPTIAEPIKVQKEKENWSILKSLPSKK